MLKQSFFSILALSIGVGLFQSSALAQVPGQPGQPSFALPKLPSNCPKDYTIGPTNVPGATPLTMATQRPGTNVVQVVPVPGQFCTPPKTLSSPPTIQPQPVNVTYNCPSGYDATAISLNGQKPPGAVAPVPSVNNVIVPPSLTCAPVKK